MVDAYDFKSDIIPDKYNASFYYTTNCDRYYDEVDGYFYKVEEKQHHETDLKQAIKQLTGKTYPDQWIKPIKQRLEDCDIPLENLGYITSERIVMEYEEFWDFVDDYFGNNFYMDSDIKDTEGYFYIAY